MNWPRRVNKWGARQAVYKGTLYHSQKEARYAAELDLRIKAGELKSWKRQVPYRLPRQGRKRCTIIPDFLLTYPDGHEQIIEIKGGMGTPEWRVKWKWFESEYPELDKMVV
jgi:hypothetical protein